MKRDLNKVANALNQQILTSMFSQSTSGKLAKKANIILDELGYAPAAAIPYVGGVASGANSIGSLHGALSDKPTEKDIKKIKENGAGLSLIPGVGSSRSLRKQRYYSKDTPHGTNNIASEIIGPNTAAALSTLAGAGIGLGVGIARGGREGAAKGAGIGAGVGAGISGLVSLASAIAATVVKRRTAAAQNAYDQKHHWMNYVVPGPGTFHHWKRIGSIAGQEEAADAEQEKKKNKDKKAKKK